MPHQRSAPPSRRLLLGVTPFPALSPTEIDAHARKIEFVHRTSCRPKLVEDVGDRASCLRHTATTLQGVSAPSWVLAGLLCRDALWAMASTAKASMLIGMQDRFVPLSPLGRRLVEHRSAILAAARHRHASNVRVFGSIARGEDRSNSDVDLLVDLDPSATAFDLLELGCDLEDELDVRVDVGTSASLRPLLRSEVLAEALAL